MLRQARRLGHGVRVEHGLGRAGPGVTGPEAERDDLLVVRVALDPPFSPGRAPAVEARDGKIEGAPEEMNRAALAAEARAETLEDRLDAAERLPVLLHRDRVIARVLPVVREQRRHGALLGHPCDADLDSDRPELPEQRVVKFADRSRRQREGADVPFAVLDDDPVVDEIEVDGQRAVPVGHRARRQPSRGDVERDVPPLVHLRRQRQTDLADDLHVELQRGVSVAPVGDSEFGPLGHGVILGSRLA